ISLLGPPDHEALPAAFAPSVDGRQTILARTVRVERRGAVGAHNPQVLEPIVVGHAVDVVQDQGHPQASPYRPLPAEFAERALEPGLKQPYLERTPLIGRPGDEHLIEGLSPTHSTGDARAEAGIEVARVDLPDRVGVAAKECVVATGRP